LPGITRMTDYLKNITEEFQNNKNPKIALGQKAYMKYKFEYLGITSPIRKNIQKSFLVKSYLPQKESLEDLIKILWQKPEREFQYFAQELLQKYTNQFEVYDISLFEYLITNKSWWDTVDFLASNILGPYFMKFPEQREVYIEKWITSNQLWLQRSALLFQLKYKLEVDTKLLSNSINSLLGSKEFFINKAIGWSLRQYGKYNPEWVVDFSNRTSLENLSRREALRIINKG